MSDPSPRRNGVAGIAGGVVDALKASPALLMIGLLNCVFVAGSAYFITSLESKRSEIILFLLEHCSAGGPGIK